MSSLRQIEANRRNAQSSTGPRSAEGKAASSMNALKSGIDAESNIIRGENAAGLQALTETYYRECQPATALERFYVDILIRSDWQLRRLGRAEAELWEDRMRDYNHPAPGREVGRAYNGLAETFTRLQRRQNDILRASMQARKELKDLQSARQLEESNAPAPEIGFVPERSGEPAPRPAPDPRVRPSQPLTTPAESNLAPEIGFVPETTPEAISTD